MTTAYRPASGTGTLEHRGIRYAAVLPTGPIVVLDAVAWLIWSEACSGPAPTLVDRVAAATEEAPAAIADDVERVVAELVRAGLLVEPGT